ncbi:MAG: bifunctional 4-hydroxy-2-oxoglutarate aldolase/2-dehydro-3-deoxy-phosphogluconate aldolase [Polyangiaceae bacterium]|nr:bifunctional 4-hydroxy-2-oxoglutarate aldolase/2-dehydro-3-deoxy-phosphogluconate aldolase [Polyangiaceae bacterium]MCL4749540.1 bifunctional 4-hydroxy-2-oxoglutarate aldolase/2-dehydro-3-deoxy-phosphogluconate aldolase [Myxococcales bacterium]
MSSDAVLAFIQRERAIAILRCADETRVAPALGAAVRGGFRCLEVTLNTPGALDAIARLAESQELCVGAGTVLTSDDARRAVEHGARFLVSPVVDPEVIRVGGELGAVVIPGAFTPTELLSAHRAGAPLQKLFPAPPDGPDYVRACLGPLPFLRIVPTSGVRLDNAADFLSAGAFALGFVRSLFEPEDLAGGAFDRIEERARAIVGRVRQHADVRRNQPA